MRHEPCTAFALDCGFSGTVPDTISIGGASDVTVAEHATRPLVDSANRLSAARIAIEFLFIVLGDFGVLRIV